METRTFYGQYSLKHWIDLIIKRNIILPDYQRSFVWDKEDIIRLIKSFEDGQFIQPVTIGSYDNNNIILDGQQRLTSILLAFLKYIPNKKKFEEILDISTEEYIDDQESDQESDQNGIEWTFNKLLLDEYYQNNNINQDIISKIKDNVKSSDNYIYLDGISIDSDFFENKFLGFSYIVPSHNTGNNINEYYAKLFRSINYFGKKLTIIESRRSLYYLDQDKKNFFEGLDSDNRSVLFDIKIKENFKSLTIDFIRYLSILSQYHINGNADNVMKYYSSYSYRESFYADYISFVSGLDQEKYSNKFDGFDFDIIFQNWNDKFNNLYSFIENNFNKWGIKEDEKVFSSWIDADYWLFGAIYKTIFLGETIENPNDIIKNIKAKILEVRNDISYTKSPNILKHIRQRLKDSIMIYTKDNSNG